MCTYLKNMKGKKPKELKNKSFDSIKKMFDRAFKWVNTFVDFRTDLVDGSSKRAGDEVEQEVTKKQKVDDVQEIAEVDDDQETTQIKELMKIVSDEEEIAIDVIPLATKPPTIVDWKIHKEGKNNYYQIIRANGSSKMYRIFSQMLKSFNKQDLEDLYKLVKAKYGSIRPMEDLDLILYGDLKTMFNPHVEDTIWRNQQDYRVLDWKIYDSCGVHSLRMQHVYIHMLVEKRYPLTPATITNMLNKKLQCDHFSEMIIMVNVIPPNHVDDVPVVKLNQHDDVPVILEPVLVDEDEDPQEEEFEEEEEPQEEEDDMEVDIEEDENEPELTYPYEEVDPLNPPLPASDSEHKDVIEVQDTIESEDKTIPTSVHEVGESSTAPFLREDNDGLFPGLTRRDINSLFGRMASNLVLLMDVQQS
ncbi:hypothetical protein Tco_0527906 [Tanacetum coccineum]